MRGPHPLNLNHLRYFFEVARSRTMKRAAARIGVSQPALSKQIQALEEALGLQLFIRSSRGMKPTPHGRVVLAHCERVFDHIRDLEDAVDRLRSGSDGRVAIAAVNSIGVHVLPDYLRRFREAHPRVQISLVTCASGRVIELLLDHQVDVGLVAGFGGADDIGQITLVQNPLRVVVGPRSHLASSARGGGTLPPEALDGMPMVSFDRQAPTCRLTSEALAALKVTPTVVAESPDIEVLKRLVEIDLGFAILPAHSVRRELASGQLVEVRVEGLALDRDIQVVYRSHGLLPPAARHFIQLVVEGDGGGPAPSP